MGTAELALQMAIYRCRIQQHKYIHYTVLLGTRKKIACELHDEVAKHQWIEQQFTLAPPTCFFLQTLDTTRQLGNLSLNHQPVTADVTDRLRSTAVRRRFQHTARCRWDHQVTGRKEISFSVKQKATNCQDSEMCKISTNCVTK